MCYIPKEDTSSLAIYLEALFISLIVDARELRDTAIFCVPGPYLNSDMPEDKFIILNTEGGFLEIM